MINPISRRKQDGVVTILTKVAGQDVIEVFTNRVRAVMTAETVTRDIGMIEICR